MSDTPREVVDELVADAVAEQRKRVAVPDANRAKDYIAGIVERMDRRQDDARLRIKPNPPEERPRVERSTESLEQKYQRRAKRHGIEPLTASWTTTRKPAPETRRAPTTSDHLQLDRQREALKKRRLRERLRLLRSLPEWCDRLKQINPLVLQGHFGADKQRHAEELVKQVIRASNEKFGHWMKPQPKKLVFSG